MNVVPSLSNGLVRLCDNHASNIVAFGYEMINLEFFSQIEMIFITVEFSEYTCVLLTFCLENSIVFLPYILH